MKHRSLAHTRLANTKAIDPAEFFASTITLGERARTQFARNVTALQLVSVAKGIPAACASIIARDCAQQPLRLYRAGSVQITTRMKSRGWARDISRKRREMLADHRRVGVKASQWADLGGNVVEVTDHPVLDLLNKPNPIMTGTELAEMCFWFKVVAGEHFDAIADGEGRLNLWPLYAHATEPVPADPSQGRLVDYYAYGRDRSNIAVIAPEDVVHYKYRQHPNDPYHGHGPLHDCYESALVLAENTEFDREMIERGNIPPGLLSLDPKVYSTVPQVREVMEQIRTQTRGRRGKSEMLGIAGASFIDLSKVGKDLQSMERLDWHKAIVRQAFGIPETVLDNRASSFASAEQGDDAYWASTIRPMLVRDAEQRTEALLPLYDEEPGVLFFAYDDPVLEDARAEAELAEIDLRTGVRSINEVRESRNLPGIGEDGDVYRINGVPAGESFGSSFDPFTGGVFGRPRPQDDEPEQEDEPVAATPPPQKVEETALNGAQIAQLLAIAERVTQALITREAGLAIASASFPGIPPEKLEAIFSKLVEGSADEAVEVGGDDAAKNRVPVVGTLDAKGNGDGKAIELDSQKRDGPDGHGGRDLLDAIRLHDRGQSEHGSPGVYERVRGAGPALDRGEPVCRLDHRHARPDPYADCTCCGLDTKDDDDRFVQDLIVRPEAISPELARRQTEVLRGAMRELADTVEDYLADAKESMLRQVVAGQAISLEASRVDQLARLLEPTFRDMFRAGFDFGALELGEDPEIDPFSLPNAEAIEAAQESLIRRVSEDITDHAAQSIEQRVRAGIEAGDSVADIAKGIEEDTNFARYRAERIARTEVSEATNAGKRARYKEAGVKTVYWVNAPGASAVHRLIAAKYPNGQDIDKPFLRAGDTVTAGGESETYHRDIYAPPARPNCRCSIQTRRNEREEQ